MNKLMESVQAFVDNDLERASRLYREYFLETAQRINREIEESAVNEEFGGDMGGSLCGEVGYPLEEEEDEFAVADDDGVDEFAADVTDDVNDELAGGDEFGDESEGEGEVEMPTEDEWREISDHIDELTALFNEMGAGTDEVPDDFGGEGESEEDESEDEAAGDESFDDIEKDEQLGESADMFAVSQPEMKDAVVDKTPMAPNAKSPVDGVKPVVVKDGTVTDKPTGSIPAPKTPVKQENNDNRSRNGKGVYKKATQKPAASKETTADNTKSTIQPRK